MLPKYHLELLSPARDVAIAKEAILHGADAVYIGGPGFGARHNAANSVRDIAELVAFAHVFHARVFVALNTILHDDELEPARKLIHEFYDAGVDALIVQDMGVLEMAIPPIELHASTQCDIRRLDKAIFLDRVGFSQIVLARELTLRQIREISDHVSAGIEFFIHGALCVAFSGQCNISHAQTGRSANRGDCSQACRLPYTLKDEQGRVVAYDKHLLSMKDNNQSANLRALVEAGVRSFKIEGRYKDMSYVKNITAHYRQLLDEVLAERPDLARASSGYTQHFFVPDPDRTFHRGSTDYFVNGRQQDIGAFDSPKFIGLPIGEILSVGKQELTVQTTSALTNGDGLNTLYKREIVGFRVNNAYLLCDFEQEGQHFWQYRVIPNEMPAELSKLRLPHALNRNLDHNWQQALSKTSSERKISVNWQLELSEQALAATAISEEGICAQATLQGPFALARQTDSNAQHIQDAFSKLGNTPYYAEQINLAASQAWFVPGSQLKALRREIIEQLTAARVAAHSKGGRKAVHEPAPVYPDRELTFLANVYNKLARRFYKRYGVELIAPAFEAHQESGEVPVMVTKHCLRFSFNLCPKQIKNELDLKGNARPMQLLHGDETITLKFDCKACEMHVMGSIKPHIFNSPQSGSVASGTGYYDLADLMKNGKN
ncbi:U32 family peptidase [Nitrosomonas sp.]|uniref:peptidase U32 family protein n=1 Tax=Nitrosomonas sp. TaxID=42353 RepID=UPI0025DFE117|nr:U32 family peptidase [Nitrosomonas sp.]MCC6916011.1 U32 family peptidase [Nitrosomonas sp.]